MPRRKGQACKGVFPGLKALGERPHAEFMPEWLAKLNWPEFESGWVQAMVDADCDEEITTRRLARIGTAVRERYRTEMRSREPVGL